MSKPAYTYIVGWLARDVYYYGFRSHDPAETPEDDFWKKYFTSSALVKRQRLEYGEPDLIEIDRRFKTIKSAKAYETWYLQTVADIRSPKWLNKSDGAGGFCHDAPHSDSAKAKMREAKVGRVPWNKGIRGVVKQSPESIAKRVAKNTGKKRSQETKDAIGAANKVSLKAYYENGGVHPMLGKKQSEESKKKMSDSLRGLVPWNLGVPHTDETRMKISIAVNRHYDKNRAVAQSTETLGE